MASRVLVTGASGLIGSMVVKVLKERGFFVIANCRSGPVVGADQVVHGDLLDDREIDRVLKEAAASHLVHLAWYGGQSDRWHAPENLDWAAATIRLVHEFTKIGGVRAVCAGSCAEYDWSDPVLSENSPLNPTSMYGKAKAGVGTLLCDSAGDMGLSLVWARIFFCYGPNEPKGRLLGDLIDGLRNGKAVDCTDGAQERDFLHTHDVGRALVATLESPLEGPVNIGSGRAVPVGDIIETAARQMGRPELIRLGAIARPSNDPPKIQANISRLKTTSFGPIFDIESGVQNCIQTTVLT